MNNEDCSDGITLENIIIGDSPKVQDIGRIDPAPPTEDDLIGGIKILDPKAVLPVKAHEDDAGLDLVAITKNITRKGYLEMGTGLAINIPKGHVGLIFPRSSISDKNMSLTNAVGVIDSGYSGEVKFRFKGSNGGVGAYNVGDRVGQLLVMAYPKIKIVEVSDLPESERGESGFGDSGI